MEPTAPPLWVTELLNKLLARPTTAALHTVGISVADPQRPIPNYVAMEICVLLILVVAAVFVRRRLSVRAPGRLQQALEVVFEFTTALLDDVVGPHGQRYWTLIGTLGLFVVVSNLIGIIPGFRSPTAHIQVTLGCAVAAFLYYNFQGIRHHGLGGYFQHLCGPVLAMSVIMFPIEMVGHLGRLLSLSVRLYANMSVGSLLEEVFAGLVPLGVPVLFMGLHVFVSFLQAYIFMLLPAVYLGIAVAEEH